MSKIPLSFINNKFLTFNADGKYHKFLGYVHKKENK